MNNILTNKNYHFSTLQTQSITPLGPPDRVILCPNDNASRLTLYRNTLGPTNRIPGATYGYSFGQFGLDGFSAQFVVSLEAGDKLMVSLFDSSGGSYFYMYDRHLSIIRIGPN